MDLPTLRDDAELVARLHRRLLSHQSALPEDASLEWRWRVKHLLGATAPSPGEGFSPNLTPIKAGPLCDYDFGP
ncbi:hypothetical protein Acor_50710 [Acrocarpospora corrugata]|uniref:Uncharacterized protein n=1 Tax=Acrocarpospora corrugata TaxID=35763 RepID=A0A5M3W1V0_9ACTN|nr:hypothetical protein [Acrocarpospora corrugata]GES03005.1 hypothetical protein Acor_50710 [Acrocarpospora corrugata]